MRTERGGCDKCNRYPPSIELTEEQGVTSLTAKVLPETAVAQVSWSSSDATVASVNQNGGVTPLKAGTATITATAGGKSGTCKVTVNSKIIAVTGVSLDKSELSITKGGTATLKATVAPDNATNKNVTWKSSDASIASVDNTGKVTAVEVGEATLTVTTEDGNKSATCKVIVKNVEAASLALSISSKDLIIGDEFKIIATVLPDNVTVKEVAWSSSNPTVASVNVDTDGTTGVVKAISEGTATLTATIGSLSKECTIKVSKPTGIEIPDQEFRAYMLSNFDSNNDGILTADEAKNVTDIALYENQNIKSLKGIEYCTYLQTLSLSYCKNISEIDLSHNIWLSSLHGPYLSSETALKTIDISALIHLKTLNLEYTNFESIDFSNCTELLNLSLGREIKTLDISALTKLDIFNAICPYVKSVDLSNNVNIEYLNLSLDCENVIIPTLPKLITFSYEINKTTKTLDLSNNTTLENLSLYSNSVLQNVDISKCENLSSVKIQYCDNLQEIDLSKAASEIKSLEIYQDPFVVWLKTNQVITSQDIYSGVILKYKD